MLKHTYHADDVRFLLQAVKPEYFSVEEKEARIQSGTHYSQMLSQEKAPEDAYLALFDQMVESFGPTLAKHVVKLAGLILVSRQRPVLVSLARAGTPFGVMVRRLLAAVGVDAPHYTVSIVRDRGLDLSAMDVILQEGHAPEDIVFIDGWTGKGVIRRTLSDSLRNAPERFAGLRDELFVLSDIAGVADFAAVRQDILIPSCMLNAPVSGLVSRTVTCDPLGHEIHGGVFLDELADCDRSLAYVNSIVAKAGELTIDQLRAIGQESLERNFLRKHVAANMTRLIDKIRLEYSVRDDNMIKPGLGEASRVLLRRVPRLLIVADAEAPEVAHLISLADQRDVPVAVNPKMGLSAIAIIKEVGNHHE